MKKRIMKKKKILIIRFSSYGDVIQSLSAVPPLKEVFPNSEIHWVTRFCMKELLEAHPYLNKVWALRREEGFKGLKKLVRKLKKEKFTHIYDAHNNLRSHYLSWCLLGFLRWRVVFGRIKFLRRPSERIKRFFLFSFRINFFEKPFHGRRNFLKPLKLWNSSFKNFTFNFTHQNLFFKPETERKVKEILNHRGFSQYFNQFIVFSPSASYPLKRWPLSYWKTLVDLLFEFPIVVLGGPKDEFLKSLKRTCDLNKGEKTLRTRSNEKKNEKALFLNLTGVLSFIESVALLKFSKLLITNDTGLMHAAEQMGKPCLALMGPTAFGFPSSPLTKVMHLGLKCSPCSPHGENLCNHPQFQHCLRGISPEQVKMTTVNMLRSIGSGGGT